MHHPSASDPMLAVGPEVVRFWWDGRDKYLSVDASPTRFCSAPNEWKNECNKLLHKSDSRDGLWGRFD
jgi:hypothetical protein